MHAALSARLSSVSSLQFGSDDVHHIDKRAPPTIHLSQALGLSHALPCGMRERTVAGTQHGLTGNTPLEGTVRGTLITLSTLARTPCAVVRACLAR
jgi:hypothetical protein